MRWVVRKGEGKEREADGERERKMGDIKEIVIAPWYVLFTRTHQ